MATRQYTKGIEAERKGEFDWLTADIRAFMVDTAGYTVNLDTDQFLSAIPLADRVAMTAALSISISVDTGTSPHQVMIDAADSFFANVTGDPTEAVVIVNWTGDAATSHLLIYMDGASVAFTPNGNNVVITFSASGIARDSRGS